LMSLHFLMMTNLCSSGDFVKNTTYDTTHFPVPQFPNHHLTCH
jgi:hypothetical protein